MKLKRFEALTLQEALQAVKAELGPDAVVVSTRRVTKSGGLFGLFSQPMVEVTAAVDRQPKREPAEAHVANTGVREARVVPQSSHEHSWYEPPASQLTAKAERFSEHLRAASMLEPVSQQLACVREDIKAIREGQGLSDAVLHPLRQEMEQIRGLVEGLLADRAGRKASLLPGDLAVYHDVLVEAGLSHDFSYQLLRSTAETLGVSGLTQTDAVLEVLKERIAESLSVSGQLTGPGRAQKIVILAGPTGVGKTTTIAKLASRFTHGPVKLKTVVMTVDTYRVAAVEQLRVYARILKVPLEVAVTPEELPSCVARHPDAGLILVDTTGRNPFDPVGLHELSAMAGRSLAVETHLVIAGPTDPWLTHDIVRRYAAAPVHRLLFTKLDETGRIGPLLNLAHQSRLPISYVTTGQRVPEDLEEAAPRSLVDRLSLENVLARAREKKSGATLEAA